MAGLAQSVEQVEMYLYVISHLTMMQEYELLRCDRDARVIGSNPVSSLQYGGVSKLVNTRCRYSHTLCV